MKLNRIQQLLINNKGRGKFNVEKQENEATIYLYDAIVDSEADAAWFGGVSAEKFVQELMAIDAPVIHLRVNSPGGSVFAGRSMETAIRNHKAKVIAHVDGYAASAASFVIMGADEIEMSPGAFLMIHRAWAFTAGNAEELEQEAKVLSQIDNSLADTYARRTGIDQVEILAMLSATTWIEAKDAVEQKFADRVAEGKKVDNRWDLSTYPNAPGRQAQQPSQDNNSVTAPPTQMQKDGQKEPPLAQNNDNRDAYARAVAANIAIYHH